jgi:hypothetical protein
MMRAIARGIDVECDPGSGVVSLRAHTDARFDEANTRALLAQLDTLLDERGYLRILTDARHASRITLMFSLLWADFLKERRARVALAGFNLPPGIADIADNVARVSGARMRMFAQETEARAWLIRQGP